MLISLKILTLLFSPQNREVFHAKQAINLIRENGVRLILEFIHLVVHVEILDIVR